MFTLYATRRYYRDTSFRDAPRETIIIISIIINDMIIIDIIISITITTIII